MLGWQQVTTCHSLLTIDSSFSDNRISGNVTALLLQPGIFSIPVRHCIAFYIMFLFFGWSLKPVDFGVLFKFHCHSEWTTAATGFSSCSVLYWK